MTGKWRGSQNEAVEIIEKCSSFKKTLKKSPSCFGTGFLSFSRVMDVSHALSTLPDFRQLVQTCSLFAAPLTLHFTLLILEFQTAFVLL